MQAVAIMEHRDRIIETKDGEKFLPVSVIYGPNGGGKSNVLEALHTLNAKILRSIYAACDKSEYEFKARKISVEPFAFSEETRKEPTQFEVLFRTDAAEYCYILHMRQDFVMHESLDRIGIAFKLQIQDRVLRLNPKEDKKAQILNAVRTEVEVGNSMILNGFTNTLCKLENILDS